MWALLVGIYPREWDHMHGHVSATTRIKSNIQIAADRCLQNKKKKEKNRGPFCNCAVPRRR